MEEEVWKDIIGYEGIYQVSNFGKVRRIAYFNKGYRWPLPKYLKPRYTRKGYVLVALNKDGQIKAYSIHRLVMAAFVGPCPDGIQVNHRNGIKDDNRVDNLEYVTGLENIHHARAMGNWSITKNEAQQRLTDDDIRDIRLSYSHGMTQINLGKQYGVSKVTIYKIIHRLSRSWII